MLRVRDAQRIVKGKEFAWLMAVMSTNDPWMLDDVDYNSLMTWEVEPNDLMMAERREKGGPVDASLHCDKWALAGECEKNPEYMLAECSVACSEQKA